MPETSNLCDWQQCCEYHWTTNGWFRGTLTVQTMLSMHLGIWGDRGKGGVGGEHTRSKCQCTNKAGAKIKLKLKKGSLWRMEIPVPRTNTTVIPTSFRFPCVAPALLLTEHRPLLLLLLLIQSDMCTAKKCVLFLLFIVFIFVFRVIRCDGNSLRRINS